MAKKPFQRSQLGAPYDDMVVRVYEHVLQLMQEAVAGRRFAVASRAARLAGQAKALAELLVLQDRLWLQDLQLAIPPRTPRLHKLSTLRL